MFNLGAWEWIVILIVVLLVLGPKKLPELARGLGKGLREFREASKDFRSHMEDELHKPTDAPSSQINAAPKQLPQPESHSLTEHSSQDRTHKVEASISDAQSDGKNT